MLVTVIGGHFKILHVEFVHRCNYTHLPTAKRNGVRFMIRVTF